MNNTDTVPDTDGKLFNSYNQPSINKSGLLVFRARSKGPKVMSGIYQVDARTGSGILRIADRTTEVPSPNNTMSTFNEFPSIPRIAENSRTMATRANFAPVWNYLDGAEETRAGTTGIFLNPGNSLATGVGLLGAIPAPAGATEGVNWFPY